MHQTTTLFEILIYLKFLFNRNLIFLLKRIVYPEQININWSPDKKLLEGRSKKLVALTLHTHNEDKVIEYVNGKLPLFFPQIEFFVKRNSIEEFKKVFENVIKKCQ